MDAEGEGMAPAAPPSAAWPGAGVRERQREALQRRLQGLHGPARALVQARIDALEGDPSAPATPDRTSPPDSALADLLAVLQARRGALSPAPSREPAQGDDEAAGPQHAAPDLGQLEAVQDLRRIWSQVRTRSQVRQSLQRPPGNAGPLNSGSLVHRALSLMRDTSPGYLQHFMAYIDALACLEEIRGPLVPVQAAPVVRRSAPRAAPAPKPRPKKRKPKRRLVPKPDVPPA